MRQMHFYPITDEGDDTDTALCGYQKDNIPHDGTKCSECVHLST